MKIIGNTPDGKLIVIISPKEIEQIIWTDEIKTAADELKEIYESDLENKTSNARLTNAINSVYRSPVSRGMSLLEFKEKLQSGLIPLASIRNFGPGGKKILLAYLEEKGY